MASSTPSSTSTQAVPPQAMMAHVNKLSDADPDFRFMGLTDLLSLLNKAKPDFLKHDYNIAARTVDSVLLVLDDQNGEVQNLALKCIGPLVKKLPVGVLPPMIDKLSSLKLKNAVDDTIPALAMRSLITALDRPIPGSLPTQDVANAYNAISRVLIPRLIGPDPKTQVPKAANYYRLPSNPPGMLQGEGDGLGEAVDIAIELIRCFGPLLQQVEVECLQEALFAILERERASAIAKRRAVVAISMIAVYLSDANISDVVRRVTVGLIKSNTSSGTGRLYVSILGSMARSIPTRLGRYLPETVPFVLGMLSEEQLQRHMERVGEGEDVGPEFNEVRETALVALEAFLASCPQEMKAFTSESISSCLRYLKYDPNFASDDDDEMSVDEEQDDDDDEFEADDDFGDDADDDDDASWKVRRCAAKALYTLISTRGSGDLLENGVLYKQAAPDIIKRLNEREENVRLEIISALSLLIRKTGEGLHTPDLAHDDYEPELIIHNPINRKRRRQSSGGGPSAANFMRAGLASPVAEEIPAHGPRADLSRMTPSILKAAAKHLKGKSIPTKQATIMMLDDLVSVQRGGLVNVLPDIVNLIIEAVKPGGSGAASSSLAAAGGASSATPSTLRIAALRLISDVLKTHSSAVLQPYLAQIVASVAAAACDRFYKISSEGLRTTEELVKAITPPRCQNAGAKYKGELEKLYDVIVQRSSGPDADAEVRQRAIHALGVIVSRASTPEGSALLSEEKREFALNVLLERLMNETTRLAAVRATDTIVAFTNTPGQLGQDWIQQVALELAVQLRKSNRSLRGSSMKALRNLVLCGAVKGQLQAKTVQGIASALLPTIKNTDTQLLGPAFLILASMVKDQTRVGFVDREMVAAICEFLRSHFASIVLDQLLEFIGRVGHSGMGGDLMLGLLKEVSVHGDPGVVGKVIGTLLVTGGDSAGVSLDSFISELHASAKTGDDARVSLALAVLGESGMRLGPASPLRPEIFLEQFHEEPDRVSLAAAIALGRAGSSNVPIFLPVILETMREGGNTQYLLIQSIKEILHSAPADSQDLRTFASQIWKQLLSASLIADNKVVCAECVGRLTTLDPATFMPQLQTLLKNESIGIRGMAVQAIRYTLPESDQAFDALLRNVLIEMLLTMLQDSDMEIRRLAMTTLNSAAHNKPDLILPHLGQLVPYVLSESVIKTELVREVMLGPFKHKVDDGLEVRKNAYETLYALMETAFTRINIIDFYDRVVAGLKDDNDIRQLCNLMVAKLIVMDPDETVRRLDAIAEAYRGVLSIKLKDNAVKQDVEKQEETSKSILRVTLLLGDRIKAMTGNANAATSNTGPAGVWSGYWEWVNKDFEKQIRLLREETRDTPTRMV